jgi:hypothetical protein
MPERDLLFFMGNGFDQTFVTWGNGWETIEVAQNCTIQ